MFGKLYVSIFTGIITIVFSVVSCRAQSGKAENKAIEKIKAICPSAEFIEMELKNGYTEVEFLCSGETIEVGLNDDNEIIYQERDAQIPGNIQGKIDKKLSKSYEGWIFDEAAIIETTDTSFYKIEMVRGGMEQNIYFTLEGKYYRPFNMAPDENWTVKTLVEAYRNNPAPYQFLKPNEIFEMPEVLREISGIALASENSMFCVQDEVGALFQYDLEKDEVSDVIRFEDLGDFEDITIDGTMAYVLRSDGKIFSFNYKNFDGKVSQAMAPSYCTDIEGLFFDSLGEKLYMACKSRPVNAKKEIRLVYEMSPDKIYETNILFTIDVEEINKMLSNKYPEITQGSSMFRFNPSAIAVHPVTGEKYVLSATDRLLAIFGKNGLKDVFPLPSDAYYKPEGLAFSENGDLYISSEGIKNGTVSGRILLFKLN